MKLSLTAIAALSATFFHPTVATGTRAAASNGNTNAAEDKPNRGLLTPGQTPGAWFSNFDVASDFGYVEEKLEARVFGKLTSAAMVSEALMLLYGEGEGDDRAIPNNLVGKLVSYRQGTGPRFDGGDDNNSGGLSLDELNEMFFKEDLDELVKYANIIGELGMFLGYAGVYGRN